MPELDVGEMLPPTFQIQPSNMFCLDLPTYHKPPPT